MPNQVNEGFLARAHRFLVYFGGFYALAIILLTVPAIQREALYAHRLRWPLAAKLDQPQYYGLAPFKTYNLNITTSDGENIGAWLVLSEKFYQSQRPSVPFSKDDITKSLQSHPTFIYFHGNAATRAVNYRVQLYSTYSARLSANVLAIDYRGFADSSGTPSEEGLGRDARAAWDWLLKNGAAAENIVIMGQSLGTGVASKLGVELSREGTSPRGIVLVAPFTSIAKLMETYSIFGFVPLMRPLQILPFVLNLIMKFLKHPFNTLAILPGIEAPIIFVHADDDFEIENTHSKRLFDTLLEPYLPPIPFSDSEMLNPSLPTAEHWAILNEVIAKRDARRAELITTYEVDGFATISGFKRKQGDVMFIQTKSGGHNWPGISEGVVDLIGRHLTLQ